MNNNFTIGQHSSYEMANHNNNSNSSNSQSHLHNYHHGVANNNNNNHTILFIDPQHQSSNHHQQQQSHTQQTISIPGNIQFLNHNNNANPNSNTNQSARAAFIQQQAPQIQHIIHASAASSSTTNLNQFKFNALKEQQELLRLKEQNFELQNEIEKLRQAYTQCQYQMMNDNIKLAQYEERIEQLKQDDLYVHKNSKDQLKYCNECNFEIKSKIALFIHKLNHYYIKKFRIPRHLHLSTRSFTAMPDDTIKFRYQCFNCKIDSERKFQKHELYMHIYQYHTNDVPYKCRFCFNYFTSNSYLQEHLIEKHKDQSSLPSSTTMNSKKNRKNLNKIENDSNNNTVNDEANNESIEKDDECMNSSLTLTAFDEPSMNNSFNPSIKRRRINYKKENEPSEIFQRLLSESSPSLSSTATATVPTISNTTTTSSSSSSSKTNDANDKNDSNKNEPNLQQIMANLITDNDKFDCKYPGCNFTTKTKIQLKFHISAHLMSKYKCPYCTFVANRLGEIKRHIMKSTIHVNYNLYLCNGCDFQTDCEKTFRDHYIRVHDPNANMNEIIERMFLNESDDTIFEMIDPNLNKQQEKEQQEEEQATTSLNNLLDVSHNFS